MGGGWCWPDAWTKDRRKEPKQCTLFRVSAKTALFTCSVFWKTVPFHCLAILTALKKMNDFACLRPEKPTIFYKMYFPSLNHDSTAHCPALGKIPFLIAFFVQASAPSWLASALPGWKFCFSPQMILIYATCILFFKPNSHWYSKEFNMSAEFRFNLLDSASLVYRKEFQYPNYISFWDSKLAYLMKANACTCAPVSINRDDIFAPFRFFIESYCRKENLQLISENNKFNWSKIFSRTFFCASCTVNLNSWYHTTYSPNIWPYKAENVPNCS